MKEDNVNRLVGGLHTDNSPIDQPDNTVRFALNAVNETNQGDENFISNEESNGQCYSLPRDFIPIGKVYLNENKTIIFLVSRDGTVSEIGIADDDCNYVTHVNDENSPADQKLNFKITNQIRGTYRLRRGCEDTVYWVDGKDGNKPRYYNFNSPESFQTGGEFDANKFELRRSYQSVPRFNNLEVLNSGGQTEPGSYNVAIQYLDEDLNPTEWIVTSPIIYIYNDDTDESFLDIRGSINSDTDYIDFPVTDKSIRVDLDNLDQTFLFYRLAFVEATNGSGLVSGVKFTEVIPTTKPFFIYTGVNFASEGTEEEIQIFSDIIESAEAIEQIENRLILSNTRGKQVDFCKLQQYASRIKADVIVKPVLTNEISEGNSKNPTVNFEAVGYMPGEIYSFGIVYVFADGSLSPVYHIPGKSPSVDNNVVFFPQVNGDLEPVTFPMKNNNQSQSNTYIDNSNCTNIDYWGVDSEGDPLVNQPVRHHRFPLRSEVNNMPLVEEVGSNDVESLFYQVKVSISGTIDTPCSQEDFDNGDCVAVTSAPPFQARVEFTVDGVAQALIINIDPADYASDDVTYVLGLEEFSELFTSNNIVITGIFESTDPVTDITGVTSPKGLDYVAEVIEAEFSSEERLYRTNVFGIQFSGVDLPDTSDTNGEEVIGYYIVRNDRTESEKTILDSAAMFPSVTNSKYISHGLLGPEFANDSRLSKNVFGFVNPEFKFHNFKYNEVTDIIQEGEFEIVDRKKSKARYRDVLDGTSYDPSIHKSGGGSDSDGWSLKAVTRDNITRYKRTFDFNVIDDDIESIFYLEALQARDINDDANTVYNIAGDNKVGILELKEDYNENLLNTIPYIYLRRDIADSYSTFRSLPYYKAINNIDDKSVTSVFGGDTFITPMRYVNTVFWDNRLAERAGRTSVWNYIIGAILVVVGVVLSVFTAGASTLVVGAGIALIGGGALFISSGVKRDALVRAYNDEYDKGLRETALDAWTDLEYRNMIGTYEGGIRGADTPRDDELQWIADCVTDLWFESQVNISIRNGFVVDTPTFLDAPGKIETGNDGLEPIYEHFGIYKIRDELIAPFTALDTHIMKKLAAFDPSRRDSRTYIGHPLGEWYQINPDYERLNRQKLFYHLPIEYDCCSDCQEEFPHRNHYSEQSFQEELTDNYRVFLPNNYRDIEGEKGEITNLYRLQNNLYIHTQEALWHLPQNIQERITGEVTSFIGTGEFFSIPPRKIVDTDTASAGTQHALGSMKTKHGIFFPFEQEKKVFNFTGNELKPLSDYGNSKWFKNNMELVADRQYLETTGRVFPFRNNPSNPFGTGYISTYDTNKERLIVTKKDFKFSEEVVGLDDYEICTNNGELIVFDNYLATIEQYENDGWTFVGITDDCQLRFSRTTYTEVEEDREVITELPNTADLHFFFDTSGSFGGGPGTTVADIEAGTEGACLTSINQAINDWVANFAAANPDWTGSVFKYTDDTERWVSYPQIIGSTTYSGENLATKDIIVISFCNEANDIYHGEFQGAGIPGPSAAFLQDYDNFTGNNFSGTNPTNNNLFSTYNSFLGIHYPIVFGPGTTNCNTGAGLAPQFQEITRVMLEHSIAALKGVPMSIADINSELSVQNPGFTVGQWNTLLTALQGANPYPDNGLENFGWIGKWDRAADGVGNVIDSQEFQDDINELLEGSVSIETITVTIQVPETEFELVPGTVIDEPIDFNKSWTMSYSLKKQQWQSWHSYLPSFYIHVLEKFYSWIPEFDNIWLHNIPGSYQTFYGQLHPHIIEYVSKSNPLITRIWDDVTLHTEARRFSDVYQEFVDERYITFNKLIAYNTRQSTGELNLQVKDNDNVDYLSNQVISPTPNTIIIDRDERDWNINDLRDNRIDYTIPMFRKDEVSLSSEYFIDKVVNLDSIDYEKDWSQLESLRDKYLVLRLIFDNFDNIRLITNYSRETEGPSFR